MFGIGFPEMVVILVVALLVVGPDKLPGLARSMAKWTVEMKKTVNELKDSLTEEENAIGGPAHSDLNESLTDAESRTWQAADTDGKEGGEQDDEILEMEDFQPPSSEELSNAISRDAAFSASATPDSNPPVAAVSASATPDTTPPAAAVSDSTTSPIPNGSDKNKVAPDDSPPSPA
ncbi:MAG TPA: twin-arginine translocase subunit TatB [Desulfobacteraceae bacterium]|nr:twin-arginine translocase subunit TatB [Desulfobacteraceae bacterium]